MAKKVQVLLVDDVDKESAADETVTFALDGVSYEIDLTTENATRLRDSFAVWIGHAERTGGRRNATRGGGSKSCGRRDVSAIREWAKSNGYDISDRGRISTEVQEAYEKANS